MCFAGAVKEESRQRKTIEVGGLTSSIATKYVLLEGGAS